MAGFPPGGMSLYQATSFVKGAGVAVRPSDHEASILFYATIMNALDLRGDESEGWTYFGVVGVMKDEGPVTQNAEIFVFVTSQSAVDRAYAAASDAGLRVDELPHLEERPHEPNVYWASMVDPDGNVLYIIFTESDAAA